jgi:preprotein translocase subunit SecG
MDKTDIKEKAIILGFTAAIFLPIRLAAGQILADNWFGMLGIASTISIILVILVKKEKLGKIGKIFKRQMTKTLWSRSIKFIVLTLLIFSAYFGTTILLIEHGNTEYYNDKQVIVANFAEKKFGQKTMSILHGPHIRDFGPIDFWQVQYLEYAFAISYAILNDATHG